MDCPGFFSVTVKAFFLAPQIFPECVSKQPHCAFIRIRGRQWMEQTTSLVTNGWVLPGRTFGAAGGAA